MPRKQHKYHYIYKTTCNVTHRYYIGMHSTSNLNDGYLGSGNQLRRSIYKYGKGNHSIEILEFLTNRTDLANREKSLITEDIVNDPNCMNITYGGGGGYISVDGMKKGSRNGNTKIKWLYENNKAWAASVKQKLSEAAKGKTPWLGKSHTAETRQKMRDSHQGKAVGELNSQFGTRWITNSIETRKIKNTDDILSGWKLGRTIK